MDVSLIGQGIAETDFSFLALFLRADIVVKFIMGILVFSSFWSWMIIVDRQLSFMGLRSKASKFEKVFWAGRSLDEMYEKITTKPDDPMARVFVSAMREWKEGRSGSGSDMQIITLKERLDRVMALRVSRELSKAERGLGVLASIGSSATFIGLLGTVWGIMNAFRSIAASHDANIAVVAPGIAEALFATALGLMAAIPAVIFYNKFASDTERYATRLEGFADELSAIFSRRIAGGK
ncbi:Tol-Pal system protein TolQ [hydrothermal vent metagenome]|uniref:Tol-Pal system protein TolQ n=1 Tax=hydrothermal vent metagenome TaxID=652676 RepID=A0A3B0R1W0_9ZZZZ